MGFEGLDADDDAAFTMRTVPFTGFGDTKASFVRHQRPSIDARLG